ncbi:hypothetical protein [Streptomyces sp. NPDC058955]|uniref:hypothetical protein n=1 Tax=unclassified Streptomyces TaxID=2593676 RepID=UPI003657E3B5
MAILVHAVLDGVTTDQYDTLNARLQEIPGIFDGCLSHACVGTDSGLEIFDVWASEAQMKAFGDKVVPLATDLGWGDQPPPRTAEIHNFWAPGAA